MRAEPATDEITRELNRLVENIRGDLDRVEILTEALSAFSRPVPDYEPRFRNLWQADGGTHELRYQRRR